jgi:hypothetical protein
MTNNGSDFAYLTQAVPYWPLENALNIRIALLLIGLFLSVSKGAFHPSFTSFSGFDSTTLADVANGASDDYGKAAESLVTIYRDLMAPVRSCTSSFTTYLPARSPAR